MYGYEMT